MVRHRTRYVPFFWIALILLASVSGIVAAAPDQKGESLKGEPQISEAPVSAAFAEAKAKGFPAADRKNTPGNRGLGSIPSPIDKTHLNGKKVTQELLLESGSPEEEGAGGDIVGALPATYDLRTLGRVSTVKDQGACGSCWAFASYGSLESTLLPAQSWDFSEDNLKNLHGFDLAPCSGGNSDMSTAYLARWSGPVAEAEDPYSATGTVSPPGLLPVEHVQEVLYLPARGSSLDNGNIKGAVSDSGAVYTSIYWTSSSYNSSSKSYYYAGTSSSNHAVAIVGWNDAYDRNRFSPPAPGDGAFIVKNSWGSSWGSSGYFHVSYYDSRIGGDNAVFTAEDTGTYDRVYQYDTLGWTRSIGLGSDTAWFANTFTAVSDESVAAVSFYTPQVSSGFTMYLYLNPTSGPLGPSGPASTVSGVIALPGYHTVVLPAPVHVQEGESFSAVVRLQTPGYRYPVPVEAPVSGYASRASAGAGQSWVSRDGNSWSDLTTVTKNGNACLKAFTQATGPLPLPVLLPMVPGAPRLRTPG